jgi:hypothetical protein
MTSATDIITYIGVPLAVLGVLPILYTFAIAILTQRRIRSSLIQHGHKPVRSSRQADGFSIRSSPMSSLIEIELPRYALAPLERSHRDYWQPTNEGQVGEHEHHHLLARAETTLSMMEEGRVQGFLKGGSWRAFPWKKLLVGRKLYRIQYEDELREPPADIDFAELVNFLLDWGAVPDSMGWEKLKSSGLWTPGGTVLLRKPEIDEEEPVKRRAADWVLRTSIPDESDGVLSLSIRWSMESDSAALKRGAASLPPGWGRLIQPSSVPYTTEKDQKTERQDLMTRVEEYRAATEVCVDSTSFRFHAEDNKITKILWERDNVETGFISEPFRAFESTSAATWFLSASCALMSKKQSGGLWGCEVPTDVMKFARKDTVPCGVLVMLGLIAEIDAPQWSSEIQHDPRVNFVGNNPSMLHHQRYLASRAAEQLEASMPPEQARIHKMNRQRAEQQQAMNAMREEQNARIEKEERRYQEAIASPRMSSRAVAEASLAWLIEKGEVEREWTVEQLAEAVLYLLVVDQGEIGEAKKIIEVLDEWMAWTLAGGMKKQQVTFLSSRKVEFCFAASLVAVIQQAAASAGKASADMLDCLKLWKRVRLG